MHEVTECVIENLRLAADLAGHYQDRDLYVRIRRRFLGTTLVWCITGSIEARTFQGFSAYSFGDVTEALRPLPDVQPFFRREKGKRGADQVEGLPAVLLA